MLPVVIGPFALNFNGQNGLIPFFVKQSATKCMEYPVKNPKARIGRNKAIITEINKQKSNYVSFLYAL